MYLNNIRPKYLNPSFALQKERTLNWRCVDFAQIPLPHSARSPWREIHSKKTLQFCQVEGEEIAPRRERVRHSGALSCKLHLHPRGLVNAAIISPYPLSLGHSIVRGNFMGAGCTHCTRNCLLPSSTWPLSAARIRQSPFSLTHFVERGH